MKLDTREVTRLLQKRLTGRTAFITGASRGIGQKIALGLAARGCDLVLHARNLKNLEKTQQELKPYAIKVLAVCGELAIPSERQRIIQEVQAQTHIDILYNNAAIMNAYKPIWQITDREWKDTFEVNVFALVDLCTGFIPAMQKRNWGRVINTSSGIQDTPSLAPYSVTKAAVDKYTRDLAAELRGSNVLVNYFDPGWLKTDLGGPQAPHEVSSVLPGALLPALLEDNSFSGQLFCAQDYADVI